MMTQLATLSVVTLNQFALDFEGNYARILKSVEFAKEQGSRFRTGPELEISGYSCEDHFYESDTINHSWEVLVQLMNHEICQGILVDVGMPVFRNGAVYNCRVIFLNKKILLIRAKMTMCDDGNYRETRWFTAWVKKRQTEDFNLPPNVARSIGQKIVPFGDALLVLRDTIVGFEICEELWTPASTHIEQSLAGAEIILNSSGSHTEIRKASYVSEMLQVASAKCGGLFGFSNLRGCDGERLYFNGSSETVMNGKILQLGEQYSLQDVEVLTTTFDLNSIREYRTSIRSRSLHSAAAPTYEKVQVDWSLTPRGGKFPLRPTRPLTSYEFCCPEEEIGRGPALWLWDYLRRSPASGFFLPLSGGVDSSSVAIIVYSMCNLIVDFINEKKEGAESVLQDVRKVVRDSSYVPTNAKCLCQKLLTTCYMGSENSSAETRFRADALAAAIGSSHSAIDISSAVFSFIEEAAKNLGGQTPQFSGTKTENLALQNIQARTRMVYAYLLAQLKPWANKSNGFLLVLGTSNVDEAIRGYYTKYDCSSADLNPIGGISKTDLKSFIVYTAKKFNLQSVAEIVSAPPTAELQPLSSNQIDEADMGMTYDELACFGNLRKIHKCGPFSMTARLLHLWVDKHEPAEIARKVKHFYVSYASNRHKMTTLTPAVHMENYSPEDHRFDLRPILYPVDFTWQFRKIDELIQHVESGEEEPSEVD